MFIACSCAIALATSLFVFATLPPSFEGSTPLLAATLLIAALLGVRMPINLMGGMFAISGESIALIACALIAPSWVVPIAVLTAFAGPRTAPGVRLLAGSQVVLASSAATLTSVSAFGMPASQPATYVLGSLGVTLVFLLVSMFQVVSYERVIWHERIAPMLPVIAGSFIATTLFALPIVCLSAWAVHAAGPIALPLLLLPLALTQYFHGLYHRKLQLTDELAEKAQVLARTNLQFAAAMVRALDQRDAYTAGHSAAVAVYTRDIAREMGFDDETVRMAHLSGLLHDIGKIGVPGRVLNKTAPLDDEEYELMKSHAAMGADILGEVDLYADIAVLVRYHHERIDGRGYPAGISGEAIPAISRMISVADTYSAMTTDRPYRDGMPTEKAMSILRECRGTQLDSDFTDAFLRILIVADEAYQRGKQTEFEVEVAKHQAMSEVEAEAVRLNEPGPAPAGPAAPPIPMLPAAVDGELIEVDLEREAA